MQRASEPSLISYAFEITIEPGDQLFTRVPVYAMRIALARSSIAAVSCSATTTADGLGAAPAAAKPSTRQVPSSSLQARAALAAALADPACAAAGSFAASLLQAAQTSATNGAAIRANRRKRRIGADIVACYAHPMADSPKVVVATHGHCFDGMASAALFTHLLRAVEPALAKATWQYRGQAYDPGKNGVDPAIFEGSASSVILDFRYTVSDALAWYFDHHASAFPTERERAHFDALAQKGRAFYDAAIGSCTKLVAETARGAFGVDVSRFEELVRWAHMIDSASFPTAEMAVERREPELKLCAVVEQQGDDKLLDDLVRRLAERPLSEVAADPDILARFAPIDALHRAQVERIRANEHERGAVVFVDLLGAPTETVTKFVTYADHPEVPYSVVASRTDRRCKVSVGFNPWSKVVRAHDISKICERYGGGGHPVVGAIALPPDPENCRRVALEIVRELGGD